MRIVGADMSLQSCPKLEHGGQGLYPHSAHLMQAAHSKGA